MVSSTGSPAGTMIQMARGAARFFTRSSSELTPERAGLGEALYGVSVKVKADDFVARAAQPLRHVAAHLAESDQTKFHIFLQNVVVSDRILRCGAGSGTSQAELPVCIFAASGIYRASIASTLFRRRTKRSSCF